MATTGLTNADELMLQGLYWWDIATFFRCPVERDPRNCDVALVGVPHSTGNGTTERDQHLGPRAVRDVSAMARRVHMEFGIDPWERARIRDMGDVPLPEANDNEACIERITEFYRAIDAAGVRPVSVGGDHSVTGGIMEAIAGEGARLTGGQKAVFLHFDAHTDAYEQIPHFLGAVKSAAHWASWLVRDGYIDARHSVQIGMRGNPRTLDWRKPSEELGYEVISMDRYREIGPSGPWRSSTNGSAMRPSTSPSTWTVSTRRWRRRSPTSRPAARVSGSTRSCGSCAACAGRT